MKLSHLAQVIAEVQKRQAARQETMPLLHEEKDMQISEKAYRKTKKALQQLETQLASHATAAMPDLADRLSALQRKHVGFICLRHLFSIRVGLSPSAKALHLAAADARWRHRASAHLCSWTARLSWFPKTISF